MLPRPMFRLQILRRGTTIARTTTFSRGGGGPGMLKWLCNWLRSIAWMPLTASALFLVLSMGVLSWFGFPQHNQPNETAEYTAANNPFDYVLHILPHSAEGWTAFFTCALTLSTIALWWVTFSIARDADKSSRRLISMERPYVTGGGDFENEWGKELFRLDVENHGKTAAFMTGYDLQFVGRSFE